MRSLKIVLAILAVLAMTGMTFAGTPITLPGLTVTDEPTAGFTNAGLNSYTVKVGGPAAFADIKLLAEPAISLAQVSQSTKMEILWDEVNEVEYESPIPTPWLISMPTGVKSFDTHFLFALPGVLVPGSTFSETNDKSNPSGMSPNPTSTGYWNGLGNFTSVGGFAFGSPLADGTPFLQVVLPKSVNGCWLRMTTPIGGVDTVINKWVGVPEPGTIALLIGGALCLVAVRFRKK